MRVYVRAAKYLRMAALSLGDRTELLLRGRPQRRESIAIDTSPLGHAAFAPVFGEVKMFVGDRTEVMRHVVGQLWGQLGMELRMIIFIYQIDTY